MSNLKEFFVRSNKTVTFMVVMISFKLRKKLQMLSNEEIRRTKINSIGNGNCGNV